MTVGAIVVGISAVRLALISRIDRAIGVDALYGAVVLEVSAAIGTVLLQTAPCLRTNTYTVAGFHVLNVRANADGLADDFVADNAG